MGDENTPFIHPKAEVQTDKIGSKTLVNAAVNPQLFAAE